MKPMLAAFVAAAHLHAKPLRVFILAEQSNMDGRAPSKVSSISQHPGFDEIQPLLPAKP